MTPALRRVAATAAAIVSSTVLLVPFTAAPASAAAMTEKAFVILDKDDDGTTGLYLQGSPLTGANGTAVVPEKAGVALSSLSVSADGQRAIFMINTYDTTTYRYLRHKLAVVDISGRVVRIIDDSPQDDVHYTSAPVLSPDGTLAAWEVYNATLKTLSTRRALVGSGSWTAVASGVSPYAFLSNTVLLVQDIDGHAFTMSINGAAKTAVPGIPLLATSATVSPAGDKLAWGLYDDTVPDGSPYKSSIQVAPLTNNGGVYSVGAATTIASGLNSFAATFSHDGSTVYFIRNDGKANTSQGYNGPGDIWFASATAVDTSTQAVTHATAADERDVAFGATDDGTAPGDPTSVPAILSGTSATVRWTNPADADLSGVLVSRNGGASHYVPAPQTSFVDTGLVPGTTYTYTFTAIDRSGHVGAAPATRQLTAIAVGAIFGDPTSTNSTRSSFVVRFATTAPSNTLFTVDYIIVGTAGYQHWVTSAPGIQRTFGSAAAPGVAATSSPAGRNYVFRVKAVDAFGNSGSASSGRAVVPYDQGSATFSGGVNVGSTSYYGTTARRIASTTNYAKITLYGNRLQIIGVRCTTCGAFALYDGSTKIATVDTRYSRTVNRTVLYTKLTTLGNHTYTIRPLATAGRPNVILDGFAMRR